ncbi:hypothetical protein J6590_060432 [Homalodisca vitripennis]|nr:hypothetical protein J6590_060432 [Homalodisca vitripennis]
MKSVFSHPQLEFEVSLDGRPVKHVVASLIWGLFGYLAHGTYIQKAPNWSQTAARRLPTVSVCHSPPQSYPSLFPHFPPASAQSTHSVIVPRSAALISLPFPHFPPASAQSTHSASVPLSAALISLPFPSFPSSLNSVYPQCQCAKLCRTQISLPFPSFPSCLSSDTHSASVPHSAEFRYPSLSLISLLP